ncbi:MAG TPA: energy transducer TonB [Candidatus Acidoferrum sp.]|nr:energy transducer TonB [Candidatus Acidoferrum sp.]
MTRQSRICCHGALYCLLAVPMCVTAAHAQTAERKILKKVEAEYPSILKRRGIGGTVRLKVVVRGDGSVKDVEILGGNPALADAAEKAVRQWKFAPGGESTITVAVTFDPNA